MHKKEFLSKNYVWKLIISRSYRPYLLVPSIIVFRQSLKTSVKDPRSWQF